jgi:hypothetical protein
MTELDLVLHALQVVDLALKLYARLRRRQRGTTADP